jgi:hypothetical protein
MQLKKRHISVVRWRFSPPDLENYGGFKSHLASKKYFWGTHNFWRISCGFVQFGAFHIRSRGFQKNHQAKLTHSKLDLSYSSYLNRFFLRIGTRICQAGPKGADYGFVLSQIPSNT